MNIHEAIKARALAALHADNLPTNAWALKNRVSVTVLKVKTDLLNECLARRSSDIPHLTKGDHKNIQREILKELIASVSARRAVP
ncbi:hypothetical protein EOW77_0006320 [Bradyrhizobium yuanmingense]|uniref:hypothetical protein n=1 Tax=Bradyrhizobium yuanmingense TaxID=108015 RepID=UPI000FE3B567|nr:hypothetical protein [Bradyrhizobium yuanmingense]TGN89910.1 hypothetical protein EOW77_0006320 [Bradyrhizobium yuanmingense]